MTKTLGAICMAVLSLPVFMMVGEAISEKLAGFPFLIAMAAYFFVCQFALSRGNPRAYRKDWLIMLLLDSGMVVVLFFSLIQEKRTATFVVEVFAFLIVCFAGTFAGAVVASLAARRKSRRPLE